MSLWPLTLFLFAVVLSSAGCLYARHLDRARKRHEAARTLRAQRDRLSPMYPPRDTLDVILWEAQLARAEREDDACLARLRVLRAGLDEPNVDPSGRTEKVGTPWDDPKGAA